MPFDVLTTIAKTTARTSASISYRRNDTKHGKMKLPKLMIAIPRAMMGGPVEKADKFLLMIGTGKDRGLGRIIRAEPEKEGAISPTIFVGGLVFRFGHVPMLGESAAEKEDMALRILAGGQWEFDLPAWFKPDEPEPPETTSPPRMAPKTKSR